MAAQKSVPDMLRFLVTHTAPNAPFGQRIRTVIETIRSTAEIFHNLVEIRCTRGAEAARRLGLGEAVATGIRDLDENWDGRGLPSRLRGEDISLYARIALAARSINTFYTTGCVKTVQKETARLSGKRLDPVVVAAFLKASDKPGFWEVLAEDDIDAQVLSLKPDSGERPMSNDLFDRVAKVFSEVIDAKSLYTAGQSEQIAFYTDLMAQQIGFNAHDRRWLYGQLCCTISVCWACLTR